MTVARLLPAALLALGSLLLAGVVLRAQPAPAALDRPDVIVIMTDDQTLADLDAMPHTRRLVGAQGATFSKAYVSYPVCCPSRATYLTGQYAHNHRVRSTIPPDGGVEALVEDNTLPVWLRAAGYSTIHIGKYLNGYGLRRRPHVPPGWTDWRATVDKSTYQMYGYTLFENGTSTTFGKYREENPALYQTDVLRDKAIQAIRSHAGGEQPYFLSLSFLAPHGEVIEPGATTQPYVRPAMRHVGRFAELDLPKSEAFDEDDVSDKPSYVRGLPRGGAERRERIEADFQARRESLLAVDEAVAAVVGELQARGTLSNTLIVFTSDNGFFQGEHRIGKGKYLAYEPSTHVPLLMRGPGIAPGTVSDELVANTDLAPTIVEAARAHAGLPMDGRSLLPFARNSALRTARPVLHEGMLARPGDKEAEIAGKRATGPGVYFAIRTRRYLYVMWKGGDRELYDRRHDPEELRSRHRDPRYWEVRQLLTDAVSHFRSCRAEHCNATLPEMLPQPLRRRGVDVPRTAPKRSRARAAT